MSKRKCENDVITNQKKASEGSFCQDRCGPISPAQSQILHMKANEGLTNAQIAARRGCSKRYVQRVVKELQDRGALSGWFAPPHEQLPQGSRTPRTIRLHAQKFNIDLIKPISESYLKNRPGKIFRLEGHSIQCFPEQVTIQAKKGFCFYGQDESEALELSLEYWNRLFIKLENDLQTMFLKDRKQNITQTYQEYATEGSELSLECEKKGQRLRIWAEDGKLRFTTDMSKGYEHEAHHHRTAKPDSEQGNRFINDILDHPEAPTYSQLVKVLGIMASHEAEMMGTLKEFTKLLKPNIEKEEPETMKGRPEYIG